MTGVRCAWAVGAAAILAATILASSALGGSAIAPRRYRADLKVASVIPAPAHAPKRAGGRFTGDLTGRTLSWTLKFHTLSGKVTAANLGLGTKGSHGRVLAPLCSACGSPQKGALKLTNAELAAIRAGKAFVELDTVKNPDGEVRGQIYRR